MKWAFIYLMGCAFGGAVRLVVNYIKCDRYPWVFFKKFFKIGKFPMRLVAACQVSIYLSTLHVRNILLIETECAKDDYYIE